MSFCETVCFIELRPRMGLCAMGARRPRPPRTGASPTCARPDSGNSTPLRSRAAFRRDSATTDSAHSGESPPGTLGVARVRAVPVESGVVRVSGRVSML